MEGLQTRAIDVAVIGGGPAGMGAALAARAAGAHVIIVERNGHLGGILRQCIHPGFGLTHFHEELTGPEYAQRFIDQVKATDIEVMLNSMVLSIDGRGGADCENVEAGRPRPGEHVLTVMSEQGMVKITCRSVVLAMGCRERTRSEIKIPGSRPAGVFTAGLAQRYINLENLRCGTRAVILGSGDIGLIMARRCALEGLEVEGVYELMPYANGLHRNVKNCLEDFGIPLHLSTTVTRIMGQDRVEDVEVARVDERLRPIPGTERVVACDTLLLSVGLIPENEIARAAGVQIDPRTRGACVDQDLQTSIPGIFSCGNVLHVHDLADNVTAEAERAGTRAAAHAACMREGHRSETPSPCEGLSVEVGGLAAYTVPSRISKVAAAKLSFRVKQPTAAARLVIRSGEEVLFVGKPRPYKPSIMESAPLTAKMIERARGSVTLSIERVEES